MPSCWFPTRFSITDGAVCFKVELLWLSLVGCSAETGNGVFGQDLCPVSTIRFPSPPVHSDLLTGRDWDVSRPSSEASGLHLGGGFGEVLLVPRCMWFFLFVFFFG